MAYWGCADCCRGRFSAFAAHSPPGWVGSLIRRLPLVVSHAAAVARCGGSPSHVALRNTPPQWQRAEPHPPPSRPLSRPTLSPPPQPHLSLFASPPPPPLSPTGGQSGQPLNSAVLTHQARLPHSLHGLCPSQQKWTPRCPPVLRPLGAFPGCPRSSFARLWPTSHPTSGARPPAYRALTRPTRRCACGRSRRTHWRPCPTSPTAPLFPSKTPAHLQVFTRRHQWTQHGTCNDPWSAAQRAAPTSKTATRGISWPHPFAAPSADIAPDAMLVGRG